MESRFNKYKSETKSTSTQIAYINSFVDYVYTTGLDVIENEINSLQSKIDNGIAPPIFTKKKNLLIELGECIERLYETYHFGKNEINTVA